MAIAETNNKAPDAEVYLSDGTAHVLSSFWKARPLLLVFLRHFG
jgi:hypothetical protein